MQVLTGFFTFSVGSRLRLSFLVFLDGVRISSTPEIKSSPESLEAADFADGEPKEARETVTSDSESDDSSNFCGRRGKFDVKKSLV